MRRERYLGPEFGDQPSNWYAINQWLMRCLENLCEYTFPRKRRERNQGWRGSTSTRHQRIHGCEPAVTHHRPLYLLLLERDVHTVGGQVESEAPGLRVQLDDDAIFIVLEVGEGAALNDRHAGCERCIVAGEIRGTGQIVDLTLCIKSGGAYVSDRDPGDFELVLFLVFAVVKCPVTPGVSDAGGDGSAAEPHIA
jgi:hypothetical protein